MFMLMLGETCIQEKIMEIPRRYIVEKKVQNLSLNVRNYAFSFKVWLGENLLYF